MMTEETPDGTTETDDQTTAQDVQTSADDTQAAEPTNAATDEAPSADASGIRNYTMPMLKDLCRHEGIEFPAKIRKADLIELMENWKKAQTPRFGQGTCKHCGAPLRVRQTFTAIKSETEPGVWLKGRRVQCKGPKTHAYQTFQKVDRDGKPLG